MRTFPSKKVVDGFHGKKLKFQRSKRKNGKNEFHSSRQFLFQFGAFAICFLNFSVFFYAYNL